MYQQPNYNNYYPQRAVTPTLNLKGHPVTSFEEVKASAVDFDGTISYFPDVANDCIYTKQINIDGTVTLKRFGPTELPNEQPPQNLIMCQQIFLLMFQLAVVLKLVLKI